MVFCRRWSAPDTINSPLPGDNRQLRELEVDAAAKIIEVDGIVTKLLSLVDDEGRQRAQLAAGMKENDFVVFHMYDTKGRPRVTIQLDPLGDPQVMLFNSTNAPAI